MKISGSASGGDKKQQRRDAAAGDNLPVFSLISHKTLKRAGFILWQFSACFLKRGQDATLNISTLTKHTHNTPAAHTSVCEAAGKFVRCKGEENGASSSMFSSPHCRTIPVGFYTVFTLSYRANATFCPSTILVPLEPKYTTLSWQCYCLDAFLQPVNDYYGRIIKKWVKTVGGAQQRVIIAQD